jgi:adenylyltransferase/sulfurtransferase
MSERYSRQVIFAPIGPEGQARLRSSTALIVGCGALGTHAAEHLARAGIGKLRLVDRDIVEWSNLHRQALYDERDAREGRLKAEALAEHLAGIASGVKVEALARDFHHANALALASGADVIIDGSDNVPTRFLLNDVSWKLGIPWIYAGVIGGGGQVQLFTGTEPPCLRCQAPELPSPGTIATCDTAGVIGPAAGVIAGWQAALAVRLLCTADTTGMRGKRAILSPWDLSARTVDVDPDPACPVCRGGELRALEGAYADASRVLCGRSAVQVFPAARGAPFDLEKAASRLASLGELTSRKGYVRVASPDGFVLTLFEDGRGIFEGITDPVRARSLYSRWVGQ